MQNKRKMEQLIESEINFQFYNNYKWLHCAVPNAFGICFAPINLHTHTPTLITGVYHEGSGTEKHKGGFIFIFSFSFLISYFLKFFFIY